MQLLDSETYTDLELTGGELTGGAGVTVERGRLRGVSLAGARFRLAQLRDLHFEECDLSGAELETCRLERLVIRGCRVTGLRLAECRLVGVTIETATGRYLACERTSFRGALLDRCELPESTFLECDLEGVELRACDLRQSVFEECRWEGADLRGSRLDGARLALGGLAGATIDADQALALVRGAGIIVEP